MLANVLLLARRELIGVEAVIADGAQTLRAAARHAARSRHDEASAWRWLGAPGDLLTLLPLAGDAEGVSTAGLLYPLADETLFFAQARGVSNVFAAAAARIWLRRGLLLVIHTRIQED